MFDLNKKIEEIRQKPEAERLRYVWGAVSVCMVFIFLIWALSVKVSLQKNNGLPQAQTALPDIRQQLDDLKKTAPSLDQVKNLGNQALSNPAAPSAESNSTEAAKPLQ